MGIQVDMRVAELLCSRLCHDLVGPVGSVNHGIELLGEGMSDVMADATDMIAQSAEQAAARLEFYRVAFGLSGGGAGQMSFAEGRKLAERYIKQDVTLNWPVLADLPWQDQEKNVPKDVIKVILNLVMLGLECLPRNGTLSISQAVLPEGLGVALVVDGPKAHIKDEIKSAIASDAREDSLTARTVQPYFMAKLAQDLGVDFEIFSPEPDCVQLAVIIPLEV
jgi:histidine phosphotransferase ChpT